MKAFFGSAAAALTSVLSLSAAHAQKEWVDTALVIAIDSSNSIESDTLDLQFRATLAALESPSVLDAIQGGYYGCIAASIVIWSTRFRQDTIANWKKICSRKDMLAFTANAKHPYYDHLHHHGSTTSLAGAIEYALNMLADCPFKAERRVIDVSGNGVESSTTSGLKYLKKYKQQAESTGITINGLPIITPRSEHDLVSFYKRNIVTQDGFLIIATHPENFRKAVERKFWIDIAFSGKLAAPAAHPLKPDELYSE
ncbi:MAG TPA: DUF1194 domain-containing protein [Geminicoccaceae bacterium]|nr:DUF1194 domain-containing protein [Geminicoccaceae bacterium]